MALPTTISTLTVNAAFLQEIKEVNLDLWRLLDRTAELAAHPQQIWEHRHELAGTLEKLRDQLALHFALEEAYGYFEDPVHVTPQLCEQAHTLRGEHRQLYMRICDVVELSQVMLSQSAHDPWACKLSAAFGEFDQQLRRHETAEIELIFREYGDDIGVGD